MAERTRRTILGGLIAATTLHALGEKREVAGQETSSARRRIIVFDVNETLLDVGALAPQFERLFGDRAVLQEWFTNVVSMNCRLFVSSCRQRCVYASAGRRLS